MEQPAMNASPSRPSRPWRWGVWNAADDEWLTELERRHVLLTDEAAGQAVTSETAVPSARIPKRIHQIWLGPKAIPSRCEAWMETWRKHHPDWEYKLWRHEDVGGLQLKNEQAFRKANNYGEKSDILRYEILAQWGGVYVDIDMECMQPFDTLIQRFAFVVGVSNTACVEINNAVIAAAPDHPILLRLMNNIYRSTTQPRLDAAMLSRIALLGGADVAQHLGLGLDDTNASSPMSTIERTGPGLMTRTFMEAIGWTSKTSSIHHEGFLSAEEQGNVVALPVDILYPLANDASEYTKRETTIFPPQTLAVHYWERTWQASVSASAC